eukprot:GDKK01008589.1.p1 GENE.GDKK01008589.1~~GDKK01008589.1.p1  ORF type:complete len:115 (-),score=21.92 GDKK01008589.1:23-367(-)
MKILRNANSSSHSHKGEKNLKNHLVQLECPPSLFSYSNRSVSFPEFPRLREVKRRKRSSISKRSHVFFSEKKPTQRERRKVKKVKFHFNQHLRSVILKKISFKTLETGFFKHQL